MTVPEARIRIAIEDDVEAIHWMIRELAEFEKLEHLMSASQEDLHRELFSDHPNCEALVAELADGSVVGYAIFFDNFSTFLCRPGLYLEDLYVRPQARKRGIGKSFLVHLARIASERDCGRLEWSVLDWNQNAIDFYQRLGASVLPDWRVVRLDAGGIERLAES